MKAHNQVLFGISLALNALLAVILGVMIGAYKENRPTVTAVSTPAATTINTVGVMDKTSDGFVFTYGLYQGHPVQLVSERGNLTLRVKIADSALDPNSLDEDSTTAFLKTEVERLVNARAVTLDNCYTFEFTGGWPSWGPYQSYLGEEGHFACINFSDHGTLDFAKRTIRARGEPNKPVGYYPYAI